MKLKKGDEIIVTTGKDRGKRAKIDAVFPKDSSVLVAGLNLFKRHVKKRDEKNPGGILSVPRPFPIGNVALICPKCKQPTRVGYLAGNKKERICKKCQQVI